MAAFLQVGSILLFIFGGVTAYFGYMGIVGYAYNSNVDVHTLGSGALVTLLIGIGMMIGGIVLGIIKIYYGPAQKLPLVHGRERKLKDYEDKYLAKQGIESTSRKPAETRESENNFCDNCGKSLRPTAKFCGSCGTSVP